MSFAQKVAALRSFMGVPDDAPLPAAVEMMSIAMGIAVEGALPKQVDALVRATGVDIPTPAAAPSEPAAHVAVGVPFDATAPPVMAPEPSKPALRPQIQQAHRRHNGQEEFLHLLRDRP